jgi:hypothetical protein
MPNERRVTLEDVVMSDLLEQITAAYKQEQQHNQEALTADDLPLSYEAITNRWLTAILCAKVPGAFVVGHQLCTPDDGTTNRRKIYLAYNQVGSDAGLPTALFCKATHHLANRVILGSIGGVLNEIKFYNDIRPLLNIEVPVAYFARQDDKTYNSMIMLGDLTSESRGFCDHRTVMSRQRAESQMRLLGKLHGTCYSNDTLRYRIASFCTFRENFNKTLKTGMREGSTAGFLASEEVIPQSLYKRHEEIWGATVAAVEELDHEPITLGHGDVHLKNWYVAGNGEMGLTDWQCAGRSHWGRDFAYAIATALTVEDRRAWEKDLLAYYVEQLAVSGGPVTDINEAWKIYRQQLISALTWWTITLLPTDIRPGFQPRDVTLEFIRRISTAMDDLGSLDL